MKDPQDLPPALWLAEAEVAELMDLSQAIAALESGLHQQAQGAAANMSKTHVSWGDGSTLHAVGAAFEGLGVVGTKTWAHTEGGASPLLILWDGRTGALLAIIEAFALGQMRTGGVSGVATRWMSRPDASSLAILGAGKQALAQLAAVAAVRPLRTVRVWSRDPARRAQLAAAAGGLGYDFEVVVEATPQAAADGADIVTLVTRAREPFFTAAMAAPGAHLNAVGAITPERQEFTQDVLDRAGLVAADDPAAAARLSSEFIAWRARRPDDAPIASLAALVAEQHPRPRTCDLSVFKAMGMGLSDVSLGVELLARARTAGLGRPIPSPRRASPRLAHRLQPEEAQG